MKYRQIHCCLLLMLMLGFGLAPVLVYSQHGIIHGRITDAKTGNSLPGVNIIIDTTTGGASDNNGFYEEELPAGKHVLVFKYIGYQDYELKIHLNEGETVKRDIQLSARSIELNTAVVSASRYEQRLSDVIVSMNVIPSKFIASVNTSTIDKTISLIPGIDIIDGQANIRGGGGYTYGAGSRVLVLLDGLPMLTGGVGDVKWNSLPVEIIDNIEIIKGASSALYGTSALNGVINIRTASPGIRPLTLVDVSSGVYMKPERKEIAWFWDRNPFYGNLKFSHLRKAGPLDIVIGGNVFSDDGYRQDNNMRYARMNAGIRYNPLHMSRLSLGLNLGYQVQALTDFLIWQDADSGAYMQNPEAITPMHGTRFNADPNIKYYDRQDGSHGLKSRYYRVTNKFDENPDKDNSSDVYYVEYQYQKVFFGSLYLTAGAVYSYTNGVTSLYGNHFGSTQAVYSQLDKRFFERWSVSLGIRWERYTLDNTDDDARPVFRTGLNYKAARSTFLRASFGQGYRYPSMAEKYTSTDLGGLNIFPNLNLKPETGWSAEIGIKQGFTIGNWSGYIDAACFWSQYNDMIEFIFGLHNPENQTPSIDDLGFKPINTGEAMINGLDVSLNAQGNFGPLTLSSFAGYTYMNPVDLSEDTSVAGASDKPILKYRYRHSAKGDVALGYKFIDLGITAVYRSFMERIDPVFEEEILGQYFFPGLKEYRQDNNKGAIVFNLRIGWQISPASKLSLHLNNLFNKEYMGRPGDIHAPRNISLQYQLKII